MKKGKSYPNYDDTSRTSIKNFHYLGKRFTLKQYGQVYSTATNIIADLQRKRVTLTLKKNE